MHIYMNKQVNKSIYFIIIFGIIFSSFVNNTKAFLDTDLWLNLYKDLSDWLEDFEKKQYEYELGWQNNNITWNINSFLVWNEIWNCLKNLDKNIVDNIANWNTKVLYEHLTKACLNEDWSITSKKASEIIEETSKIRDYYIDIAEEKSKIIHNISRISMYADWNLENSPFDIIADLNNINKIIFKESIDYVPEESSFLGEYKNNLHATPFINIVDWKACGPWWSSAWWNSNKWDSNKDNNFFNNKNNKNSEIKSSDELSNFRKKLNKISDIDSNNYTCPEDNEESWLNDNSLNALKNSLDNYNTSFKFDYLEWGHIKLSDSNKINNWWTYSGPIPCLAASTFKSCMSKSKLPKYKHVNDNDLWKCNKYFCVVVEMVVTEHNLFWDQSSVEFLLENSNKHLKKAANSSLVQSKMTINNFEISLRDLDLTEMFHMWIMVSYKTPPFLNLENFNLEVPKLSNPEIGFEEVEDMLRKKYKNIWLDYKDRNNIDNFTYAEQKLKSIVQSIYAPAWTTSLLQNEYIDIQNLRAEIDNKEKKEIHKKISRDTLKNFDKQFTEIDQFYKNIWKYIIDLDVIVKKLKEIPIYI